MLNEDELMELIDQIRFNLPDEIKQANGPSPSSNGS